MKPLVLTCATWCFCLLPSWSQAPRPLPTLPPKLEPVAETKLLMEGIALPNLEGLNKLLKEKPDQEGWVFARGQALLIAENGNLLMLRPPKSKAAQDVWMTKATQLRDHATLLARSIADKDLEKSRANLVLLAKTCNLCHESFRVEARIQTQFENAK